MFSLDKSLIFAVLVIVILANLTTIALTESTEEQMNSKHNSISPARLALLKQIFHRRSLYDPAFGDSWSKYLDRRNIFDPAYGDWSNSFKRSNE